MLCITLIGWGPLNASRVDGFRSLQLFLLPKVHIRLLGNVDMESMRPWLHYGRIGGCWCSIERMKSFDLLAGKHLFLGTTSVREVLCWEIRNLQEIYVFRLLGNVVRGSAWSWLGLKDVPGENRHANERMKYLPSQASVPGSPQRCRRTRCTMIIDTEAPQCVFLSASPAATSSVVDVVLST
ncbi:hypothetical protein BDQ17DRAFT_1410874 [Cyathus striatus]|nr:hypothetical protein BDQ17DRAFT_1410874 [Cyathus striatus]